MGRFEFCHILPRLQQLSVFGRMHTENNTLKLIRKFADKKLVD